MKYSEDIMWKATIENDKRYDGEFFYVVKTVGVYCCPSCKSRKPLRKNILFFETANVAMQAGFRACKRCHPNDIDYAPTDDLVEQAKRLIDDYFHNKKQLLEKMRQIGASPNYLATVFEQYYKMTPQEYLKSRRLEYAKQLLSAEDFTIAEIAQEVGYDSLSSFYEFFKKSTGMTPRTFRIKYRF